MGRLTLGPKSFTYIISDIWQILVQFYAENKNGGKVAPSAL
jgi:hypothetical protein